MALKVDLEKAYDRLSWNFIMDTLVDIGILGRLINIIMKCLIGITMQISWNGKLSDSPQPSRGVRQGVLCMERLAHAIHNEVSNGSWKPISLGYNGPLFSHLFFTDDLVLFMQANNEQVHVVEEILRKFCSCLGQKISRQKSLVFFSNNVT